MPDNSGRMRAGQEIRPPKVGRITSSRASRGSHIRALATAIEDMIEFLPEYPSERRIRLRDELAALRRAHPRDLALTESDVAQLVQEIDDAEVDEVP